MKNLIGKFRFVVLFSAMLIFVGGNLFAQDNPVNQNSNHGKGFVDANGDGFNDNAPDVDKDGVPNGKDSDYQGVKSRKGNSSKKGFIDLNGDGINDNALDNDKDGIPNGKDSDFVKPQDGNGKKVKGMKGSKKGNRNSGNCDGTGSKGNQGKGKNRATN